MATLTLENFTFGHLEIPSAINFGGQQMEYTHKLPGGVRVVNAMGFDPDDVSWTGYFDGITAVFRARYLQNLASAGKSVTCTYDQFKYQVLIKKFTCNFQALPLPYSITLRIITDLSNPITLLAPLGFDDAILEDAYELLTLAELVQFGGIQGQVAALLTTLTALSSIVGASDAEIAAITATLTSIGGAVGTAVGTYQNSLFNNTDSNGLPSLRDSQPNNLPLDVQAADFDALVNLYKMQYLNTRMLKNFDALGGQVNPRTVTLINANLYALATQYYQDTTLWTVIRDANDLNDFIVDGVKTLIIPPKPSTVLNA